MKSTEEFNFKDAVSHTSEWPFYDFYRHGCLKNSFNNIDIFAQNFFTLWWYAIYVYPRVVLVSSGAFRRSVYTQKSL